MYMNGQEHRWRDGGCVGRGGWVGWCMYVWMGEYVETRGWVAGGGWVGGWMCGCMGQSVYIWLDG